MEENGVTFISVESVRNQSTIVSPIEIGLSVRGSMVVEESLSMGKQFQGYMLVVSSIEGSSSSTTVPINLDHNSDSSKSFRPSLASSSIST